MNKLILFLMLLTAFSYSTETKACIVLPNNTITTNGPTTVCQTDPSGSYDVRYSTSNDAENYTIFLAVQGGLVTNVQTYTLVGNVPQPGTCVPQQTFAVNTDCNIDHNYSVPPACRGGIRFDVLWDIDGECAFPGNAIFATLEWGQSVSDDQSVGVDASCLTGSGDTREDSEEPISIETDLEQELVVDIFPNPTALGSNVTVSLPENYDSYEVKILDISGRLVQSHKNVSGQLAVNTSRMVESVYLVQVITPNGLVETKKLILSK